MDSYYWIITYPDGSQEKQLDNNCEKKLDFRKLESHPKFIFSLISTSSKLPNLQFLIDNQKRLIYFRRRIKMMNFSTGENRLIKTIYAIGWQKTINGNNIKSITWIDELTGQIYNCDDLVIHNEERK